MASRGRRRILPERLVGVADGSRAGKHPRQHRHDEWADARAVDRSGRTGRDADWHPGRTSRPRHGADRSGVSAAVGRVHDALLAPRRARVTSQRQHFRPLLLLGLLVCAFYAPQLAMGTVQWDGVDVHYSAQRYFADALHSGRLPFWTPYLFSGFPFLADVQVGAWYPLNWPFFVAGITPWSISAELWLHSL